MLASCCALLASCCALLASCAFPGSVPTTVKIGLSAPFEGLYRDLGYEVLNAVRLAVRQRNEAGGVGGRYLVEQVALNDFGEAAEAARQAGEMAVDPAIAGVLGGWSAQTARAAGAAYGQLGLAFVAPEMDPGRLANEVAGVAALGGPARVAVVLSSPDAEDQALAQAFADAFTLRGGSIADWMTPEGDDWVQNLGQEGGHPPDVIFMAADALTAAGWIAAVRDAGFEGLVAGGPAMGSSILVEIAGEASEGVLFASPFPPLAAEPAFAEAYGELTGGASPGPAANWAYVAANRLLDTMDRAARAQETPLRAAVQNASTMDPGDLDKIYLYVIQSGNVYTLYRPR